MLIDGITVLAERTITSANAGLWFFVAIISVGILSLLIVGIKNWINTGFDIVTMVAIILSLMLVSLGLCAFNELKNFEPYTNYQVIIDDDVSFNELMENYKIIEQEGKIYTITERIEE